jgi:hypothetical protein
MVVFGGLRLSVAPTLVWWSRRIFRKQKTKGREWASRDTKELAETALVRGLGRVHGQKKKNEKKIKLVDSLGFPRPQETTGHARRGLRLGSD